MNGHNGIMVIDAEAWNEQEEKFVQKTKFALEYLGYGDGKMTFLSFCQKSNKIVIFQTKKVFVAFFLTFFVIFYFFCRFLLFCHFAATKKTFLSFFVAALIKKSFLTQLN